MEKLVRDRIPEIVARRNGRETPYRIASRTEYAQFLVKKLREEVKEYIRSGQAEELADIMEVIYHLGEAAGISPKELEKLRQRKFEKRGGFRQRQVMDF